MKKITKENTGMFKHYVVFEVITNLDLKVGDVVGIPAGTNFVEETITKIEDRITNDMRHHGDITHQHYYVFTV